MTQSLPFTLRGGLRFALTILLLIGLTPVTASAYLSQPTLADPPIAPERPAGAPTASAAQAAAASCGTGNICLYLPVVYSPGSQPAGRTYAVDFYKKAYLGSAGVPAGWTGTIVPCNPGTTSQAFRDSVLLRINYYREMAGVPKVLDLRSEYNQQDQAAALMMAANQQLNHTPPNTWTCYTDTGYAGSSRSNLAMGVYGPDAITLYINEGGSLGHRRWVLYPQTQEMGTGDIPGSGGWQTVTNAMKAWDDHVWDPRPATRDAFVAWPPPGYVPYQVVYPVWSISVAGADFSQASVSVTSNGSQVPVNVNQTTNGFGENTLAWNACGGCGDWPNPGADRAYQVTVNHVLVNGTAHNYTYTVTVIDPAR